MSYEIIDISRKLSAVRIHFQVNKFSWKHFVPVFNGSVSWCCFHLHWNLCLKEIILFNCIQETISLVCICLKTHVTEEISTQKSHFFLFVLDFVSDFSKHSSLLFILSLQLYKICSKAVKTYSWCETRCDGENEFFGIHASNYIASLIVIHFELCAQNTFSLRYS